MSKVVDKATTGKLSSEDAHALLEQVGIASFQNQAGYLPKVSNDPLPITEQAFSEQCRSSRQTRHIRTVKWINRLVHVWYRDDKFLSLSELAQVEYITYQKYLQED